MERMVKKLEADQKQASKFTVQSGIRDGVFVPAKGCLKVLCVARAQPLDHASPCTAAHFALEQPVTQVSWTGFCWRPHGGRLHL
jgi:hypothetical protein